MVWGSVIIPDPLRLSRVIITSLFILMNAMMAATAIGAEPNTLAIDTAVRQFREFYLGESNGFALRDTNEAPPEPVKAQAYADALTAEGAWTDIDYASAARSDWPPAAHYTRMTAMVTHAGMAGTSPADRTRLLESAHRAFAYWIAHDFQCVNWWYNEIGTPKVIGTCALLLGGEITPEEFTFVADKLLAHPPIPATGQNRVWLAGNTLLRGLLKKDAALIDGASKVIWSEIKVTTGEGLQPDASFHQHGAQQQFGNYGMAFAAESARWAGMLRGTPWQLPAEQRQILRDYLLQGQNWVSWRGAMDISACGRQLMPGSPPAKTKVIAQVMALAEVFDAEFAQDYRAFIQRNQPGIANDLIGTHYFWRSDYLIHRRSDFAATLKLSSNRVTGAESTNSENLSGFHLGDGCLYLYRTGEEYADIFPVWDWKKLPGVTCTQDALPQFQSSAVARDFVGGISHENTGLAALDYAREGVTAKKSWFFHDDVIVCLGTGITGTSPATIATTLNQSLLRGPVQGQSAVGPQTIELGQHELKGVKAIEHDGWHYEFLDPTDVQMETGPKTGNWRKVFDNPATPSKDVTKSVFTLWLDHGANPINAHYAYSIAPVKARPSFRVLENSPEKQIVQWSDGTTALVFWKEGEMTLPNRSRLAVSAPCLVLCTSTEILVTDPTQKLFALELTLGLTKHTINFPTAAIAGTPVSIKIAR
jgi:chondroitin AC lyase